MRRTWVLGVIPLVGLGVLLLLYGLAGPESHYYTAALFGLLGYYFRGYVELWIRRGNGEL